MPQRLITRMGAWLDTHTAEVTRIVAEHGNAVISQQNAAQVFGGLRGVNALVCDTSAVDEQLGLLVRGRPVRALEDRLPEEVFFLLLTGSLPDAAELAELQQALHERQDVPRYVWDVLNAMPPNTHSMTLFSTAVQQLHRDSVFARRAWEKQPHLLWQYMLEDALRLMARAPVIAAAIYREHSGRGEWIRPDASLDYAANLTRMLGLDHTERACDPRWHCAVSGNRQCNHMASEHDRAEEFVRLLRRFLVVHCDHESGNATAYTANLVGSVLCDPYLAYSAGLNALAGPRHGMASQRSLEFVLEIYQHYGGCPTAGDLRIFVAGKIADGHLIPGYGHAVLRTTDPRFSSLLDFGMEHLPADPLFCIARKLSLVVPELLKEHTRIACPYPNVDSINGAVLHHYGLTDYQYYTVFFGLGLLPGLMAQLVIQRGLGARMIRPRSITTAGLRSLVQSSPPD